MRDNCAPKGNSIADNQRHGDKTQSQTSPFLAGHPLARHARRQRTGQDWLQCSYECRKTCRQTKVDRAQYGYQPPGMG